jgi:hypothetical protein
MKLSLATNVSFADYNIIMFTIPNWLRVFDKYLYELVIIVDPQKPVGRLSYQYSNYAKLEQLMDSVNKISELDNRIRIEILDNNLKTNNYLTKWFKKGFPYRCQSGTPIAAFIYAVEECKSDFILRCDCDMLFYENGFLEKAHFLLENNLFNLLEPPMLGIKTEINRNPSLGAFIISRSKFHKNCLPFKAHTLKYLRKIHRFLKNRSVYLNLEEMIAIEKLNNRISHINLPDNLGFSLHLINRNDVLLPNFINLVYNFENGLVPNSQRQYGRNFNPKFWTSNFWNID